jgi:uncharacterized protein VirK/YbjX
LGVAADDRWTPFKYLGDYLSLSMSTTARRQALTGHYLRLGSLARASAGYVSWRDSIVLWELGQREPHGSLRIFLEPARLAPMEGELQLRFSSGRRNLFTLTFLFTPGDLFGCPSDTVLFIGGVQGGVDCRSEMRQAAKDNGEISPPTMLLLTVKALAKVLQIGQIFAVAEENQISKRYTWASDTVKLDYHSFWSKMGGVRHGTFYKLLNESVEKPLNEIPITHRARTRRKRERKARIRETIEARLQLLFVDERS